MQGPRVKRKGQVWYMIGAKKQTNLNQREEILLFPIQMSRKIELHLDDNEN